MRKAIIYGAGHFYNRHKHLLPKDIEIIAYAHSSPDGTTSVSGQLRDGKKILMPAELKSMEYDELYICTDWDNSLNIFEMLKNFNIDFPKIRFLYRLVYDKSYGEVWGLNWQYEVLEDKSILSTIGNLRIYEKTRTDTEVIREIIWDHCYSIDILPNSIVIDMGMNVGIASLFFASHDEVEKIYGFEPFSDTYQMALDNFNLNTYDLQKKIIPCNIAVTDQEEYMDVPVVTAGTGWRNIFSENENAPIVKIKCKPAATVIEEIIRENPDKNYVLKCDTEGSEYKIFDSLASAGLLAKLDSIIMEYHKYPNSIIKLLKTNGYRYYWYGITVRRGVIVAFRTSR